LAFIESRDVGSGGLWFGWIVFCAGQAQERDCQHDEHEGLEGGCQRSAV